MTRACQLGYSATTFLLLDRMWDTVCRLDRLSRASKSNWDHTSRGCQLVYQQVVGPKVLYREGR